MRRMSVTANGDALAFVIIFTTLTSVTLSKRVGLSPGQTSLTKKNLAKGLGIDTPLLYLAY